MKCFKKIISVFIILIFIFSITACRDDDEDISDDVKEPNGVSEIDHPGNSDNFDIENYIYLRHEIDMGISDDLWDPVSGATAHGDQIICWYHTYSDIIVLKLTAEDNARFETRFPGPAGLYGINGLSITHDNKYALTVAISGDDDVMTVKHFIYDENGNELSSVVLLDIPQYFNSFTIIEHAIVTDNNIVINVKTNNRNTIYLFNDRGEILGELSAEMNKGIARLKNDRVVVLFNEGASSVLREIDFDRSGWGESHRLTVSNADRLIPAYVELSYDFFIDAEGYLIGYVLESNTQTLLLKWLESGVAVSSQLHIGMLAGNEIFALQSEHIYSLGRSNIFTDLFVFTRFPRTDIDQRTVITIGGMYFRTYLLDEIAKFNATNPDYQIEARNYFSEDIGLEGSRLRMNVDLIAGRGPDIIVDSSFEGNTEFLADLYAFIDADPDIDRSDFFPNVLQALERPAGTLPFIANNFTIITMLAKRETAELLNPYTFDNILRNIDRSDPYAYAGHWFTGISILSNAVGNTQGFIDWDSRQANFDNPEFIDLLEIAKTLPKEFGSSLMEMDVVYKRISDGRQMLLPTYIFTIEDVRITRAQIGDIIAIGVPTYMGGQNKVHIMGDIGIYAKSPNQEAAWSFVRRLLLPEANVDNATVVGNEVLGMPLRIDKFNEQIAESMIQEFWDADIPFLGAVKGEEMPRVTINDVPIYAMTEEEAAEIRAIVTGATLGSRSDNTVWMIIDEEYQAFINGVRSSADTARIIQNRVQTYLYEQG